MIILFILGLALGAVAVVFALQNVAVITVTFFAWQLTGSLALILSLAIGMGVLVTILMILPGSIDNYFRYKRLKKENTRLEEELRKQRELHHFSEKTPPSKNDIDKIEHGASNPHHSI